MLISKSLQHVGVLKGTVEKTEMSVAGIFFHSKSNDKDCM